MASSIHHPLSREHRESRGIRIRLHVHRDPTERELRSALKLAERQQNFVRQRLSLGKAVTDTRGSPSFIWRNGALVPRTPKRRPKVHSVRVSPPDAPVIRQNTFDFEDDKRKPLLDGPPTIDTKKRREDTIEPTSFSETDLNSSFGKEFVRSVPEEQQASPRAQQIVKVEVQQILSAAEKNPREKRRKEEKKRQKDIETRAKQKKLKPDFKPASGNSEHFAAWAEAYQKPAQQSEDAGIVHPRPAEPDQRTGALRWLKELLHKKSLRKQYEQVDTTEISDLESWLKPESEATSIPARFLEWPHELPAYSTVEIGDCEKGKGKAVDQSNESPVPWVVSPFETGSPSTLGNRTTMSSGYTLCDNSITCLPGFIFREGDVCEDQNARLCSPYYEDGVHQSHNEYHELTRQSDRHVSEFAAFSCSPTALEFDVAEGGLRQRPSPVPCPIASPPLPSVSEISPLEEHWLLTSEMDQRFENKVIDTSEILPGSTSPNFDTEESSSLGFGLPTLSTNQPLEESLIKSNSSRIGGPMRGYTDRIQVQAAEKSKVYAENMENSSARVMHFRDILSLEEPQDRIQAFIKNREVVATQDTGLEEWLRAIGNQSSEHSDIFYAAELPAAESKQDVGQQTKLPKDLSENFGTSNAEDSPMAESGQNTDQKGQLSMDLEKELALAKASRLRLEQVLAEQRKEFVELCNQLTRQREETALREEKAVLQEQKLMFWAAEMAQRGRETSLRQREASTDERDASIRERERAVQEREMLLCAKSLPAQQSEILSNQRIALKQEVRDLSVAQTRKSPPARMPVQAPQQDSMLLNQERSPPATGELSLHPTCNLRGTEPAEAERAQPPLAGQDSLIPTGVLEDYLDAAKQVESGPSSLGNNTRHDLLRMVSQVLGHAVSAFCNFKRTAFRTHVGTKRKASGRVALGKGSSRPRSRRRSPPGSVPPDGEEANDDDEDSDGGLRKRKKAKVVLPRVGERLLACPYSKFNCYRYSERNTTEKPYRGCRKCWLSDISRVKQHLYRVHSRPDYYCPRCYEVFESSSRLDVHVRQANSCTVIDCPYPEKLTDEQVKALRRKWPGKSMEECWYIIFGILFPNTPVPLNPYAEDAPLEPVQLTAHNAPRVLSQILRERLAQHEHSPATALLLSDEAQTLLSRLVEESMAEILRRGVLSNASLIQSTSSLATNEDQNPFQNSNRITANQQPSIGLGFSQEETHPDPLSGNFPQPTRGVTSGGLDGCGELHNPFPEPSGTEIHPPVLKLTMPHNISSHPTSLESTLSSSVTINNIQNDDADDHFGEHQRLETRPTASYLPRHLDGPHSLPVTAVNHNPFYPNMQVMQATYNTPWDAIPTTSAVNDTSSGTSSTESLSLQVPSYVDRGRDAGCMHPPAIPEETGPPHVPNGMLGPRRSIDSGYQSMITQERGEYCFNNSDENLKWIEQGLYGAIEASWGPMTSMDVQANPWSI